MRVDFGRTVNNNTNIYYKERIMNIRKITSMTMLLSFILCVITSIILYIVPHGRVAYWSDWHLFGLSKTEWSELHINLGFLLLIAGLLHVYYNWNAIKAYMKNKAKELKVLTPSFNIALIITLVIGIGTYFQVPPMSTVIDFGESFKEAAAEKYGEPPYGHAELSSLKTFTKKLNLDLDRSKTLLKEKGIRFDSVKQTMAEIAKLNNINPKQVYDAMKDAVVSKKEVTTFPDLPYPGFGRKKLSEICMEFQLDSDKIIEGLTTRKIDAAPEQSIKEIAAGADMDPHKLFEVLHEVVQSL